ncbi:ABC transporter permease [Pseudonocardia oroxyli]|uniref:Peptide/nickel transport system permease protein n=1 Tax=Pseudonocardia oroxyli TaxID=366584 RepID=A0A1G7ZEQ8_PSEOR|nr:ABC transporter permease [Pseudonocardia oroxyli]SDH07119.1 peptide/nickel transport system permease protein [Pseudonocardia oroxyli]
MTHLWTRNGWWVRRLAVLPLHLLIFALVVFFLVKLIPGDPVAVLSGGQPMTPEQYEATRASLGLADPIWVQLTTFLGDAVRLDFGNSIISGIGVMDEMSTRLPETVELAVMAMTISALLALALGFLVVLRPRNAVSRVIASYARAAGAVPDFCLGVAGVFVFYSVLHWAPAPIGRYATSLNAPPRTTGFPFLDALLSSDTVLMSSMIQHLWLPIGVLVVAYAPMLLKLFIRSLDQAKNAQATRFRIASGASRPMVLLSVGRRALPSTIAMFGTIFGFMVGGAVVVEQLFAIPGMGEYAVQAVTRADFVALRGFLLVVGAVSLIVFFLVDVVTMSLDPRRRPGVATAGG